MIALHIEDLKDFMSKVLVGGTFDRFYLRQGSVETFTTVTFEGDLHPGYYEAEVQASKEGQTMPLWSEVRPFVYQLVKGSRLPGKLQLVLVLSDENLSWLLEHHKVPVPREAIGGLHLTIRYENKEAMIVTGVAYRTFIPDKTLDRLWDETAARYLQQQGITVY